MTNSFMVYDSSQMDERKSRMKIAMCILLGPHNECKEMLELAACQRYEKLETKYLANNVPI